MTLDELKDRGRRLPDEVLTQGDLAVVDELIASDCRFHSPEPLPEGSEGIKRWVTSLRRAFPDLYAIVEEEIAEHSTVAHRLTLSGTQQGSYLRIPPSGRHATWQLMVIQRAGPDGNFTDVRVMVDHLDLLTQLGAIQVDSGTAPRKGTDH
ncbi:MAG: ester cyclase [Nitrolancea sp.]